ncbi:hypothetical protein IGI04_037025 [Brassica rapa subsp. trilocularis]|uniref:Transmembrane protein n=1 Tax=Brassica rapa subsp. trilocularis TaxID=1813537 RepID=A0ABQ7LIU1_BRACM|nr:hypothetical protein IGI04_037025 [Brassica rapa subsp. trilocularis]
MAPRIVDLILSLFISLFSHLVAPFTADHVFGGSPFRHICYSSLSFCFSVVGFLSSTLRLYIYSSHASLGVGVWSYSFVALVSSIQSFVVLRYYWRFVCTCLVCEVLLIY